MNVGYPTLEGASIPGDPEGLDAIASRLQAAHDDVSTVQERVAVDGAIAGWEGEAANKFRSSLEELPGELGTVASAFDAASSSIRSFAGQLTDFQNNAHYYASRIKASKKSSNPPSASTTKQRPHSRRRASANPSRRTRSASKPRSTPLATGSANSNPPSTPSKQTRENSQSSAATRKPTARITNKPSVRAAPPYRTPPHRLPAATVPPASRSARSSRA